VSHPAVERVALNVPDIMRADLSNLFTESVPVTLVFTSFEKRLQLLFSNLILKRLLFDKLIMNGAV
jgi:hypothetical protein